MKKYTVQDFEFGGFVRNFYKRNLTVFRHYAVGLDDLIQESNITVMQLLQNREKMRVFDHKPYNELKAFLLMSVRNHINKIKLRGERFMKKFPEKIPVETVDGETIDHIPKAEINKVVEGRKFKLSMMKKFLTKIQYNILDKYSQGLTFEEIATELSEKGKKITRQGVHEHFKKATEKLRKKLKKEK